MYPVRMAVFGACCLILAAPVFGQTEAQPTEPKQKAPPAARPIQERRQAAVDEFMKRFDMNGDGYIDRDEMPPHLRKHFDQWDVKKTGKLSREDLLKHAGMLRREEKREDLREQRQKQREQRKEKRGQAGANPLGPMALAVILRLATSDEPGRTGVQMVYEVLRKMDTNKDGNIDHAEWQASLDQVREFRVNNIMRRQGMDGKIAKEDARGMVRRRFSEWDLNQDGYIDRDELRQAFNLKPEAAKPTEEKVTTEPQPEE